MYEINNTRRFKVTFSSPIVGGHHQKTFEGGHGSPSHTRHQQNCQVLNICIYNYIYYIYIHTINSFMYVQLQEINEFMKKPIRFHVFQSVFIFNSLMFCKDKNSLPMFAKNPGRAYSWPLGAVPRVKTKGFHWSL